MASGQGHQTINLSVLAVVITAFGVATYYGWTEAVGLNWELAAAFVVSFIIGTVWVTPDLDLAENEVLAKRNWGAFGFIWVPYGYLFRHRGFSHSWLIGPLTRLLYLAALGMLLYIAVMETSRAAGYAFELKNPWIPSAPTALSALLGFYSSQWLHLLADGVGPWHGLLRLLRWRS